MALQEAYAMTIDCLRVYDYIIDEFDRHNAHNPNFAARLLPGCHSAYKLFASYRAECLEMEPRLGVPNPLPPPPMQLRPPSTSSSPPPAALPPPSTNPDSVMKVITCDGIHNTPAYRQELAVLSS